MLFIIVLLFIVVPMTVFLHEVGHGLVARVMKIDGVEVVIGTGPMLVSFQFGGIHFQFHAIYFFGAYTTNLSAHEVSEWQRGLISLGGPLVNVGVAILAYLLLDMNHMISELFVLFNVWVGLVNLIPYKLLKRESDGLIFIKSMYKEIRLIKTK
ncbi:site-2 protease family protein [Bacillus sp. PS06]|uniref:site-2 protease family protein n=1 Tax=Bacillus sp. PS06 TaxID=2764176 RepID=UPI0017858CE7|nr:site-2 protease family protein [Bacillus sp. PS06]MBD8071485.1 site-2 protease family protein [Bacillus sp. PS06]